MEPALIIVVTGFYAAAIYLLTSRHLIRLLLGIVLLSNAANLTIFSAGRITREIPPIIPAGLDVPPVATANPLPQALILTAIVISFSLFAFVLVLVYRAYEELGTDDSNEMRLAEPAKSPDLPEGY